MSNILFSLCNISHFSFFFEFLTKTCTQKCLYFNRNCSTGKPCKFDKPLNFTASRLGLYAAGGQALSGEQLDKMDLTRLQQIINNVSVFYRVSPRHKHKIIKVCQKENNVALPKKAYIYIIVEFCTFRYVAKAINSN